MTEQDAAAKKAAEESAAKAAAANNAALQQQQQAADKKAADEKARQEAIAKASKTDTGAQEAARKKVADLQKQLAEAQDELTRTGATAATTADEDRKRAEALATTKPAFTISGRPGGPFNIDGAGFGPSGTVMVSGRVLDITRWTDTSIKGMLPVDVMPGELVVSGPAGSILRSTWPPPKPVVTQTNDGRTVLGQTAR